MKDRDWVRTIALACLLIMLPLLPLLVVYYPLTLLEVRSYFQALQIHGSESYHQSTLTLLKTSIASVAVYTGAIITVFGYFLMIRGPRPLRDVKYWGLSTTVAVADVALWLPSIDFKSPDKTGLALFVGIPFAVAILSVFGALMSWKDIQSARPA